MALGVHIFNCIPCVPQLQRDQAQGTQHRGPLDPMCVPVSRAIFRGTQKFNLREEPEMRKHTTKDGKTFTKVGREPSGTSSDISDRG